MALHSLLPINLSLTSLYLWYHIFYFFFVVGRVGGGQGKAKKWIHAISIEPVVFMTQVGSHYIHSLSQINCILNVSAF